MCAALIFGLSFGTMAAQAPEEAAQGESIEAPADGESAEEAAQGESAEGESDGESAGDSASSSGPAEPTYSATAQANPDQAITLDGIAMGQLQKLITTASYVYEGGELDEALSTLDGVSEEDGKTIITSNEDNTVGIAIRNTGAFVLGGESDPALVAERINFSYITGEYNGDWEAFCQALGFDSSLTLEFRRVLFRSDRAAAGRF